jgi:hypothetical protein
MSAGSAAFTIYPLSSRVVNLALEPGGYLVWGEYDFQTWKYSTINPADGFDDALKKLLEYNATFGHTQKPNFQLHKYVSALSCLPIE